MRSRKKKMGSEKRERKKEGDRRQPTKNPEGVSKEKSSFRGGKDRVVKSKRETLGREKTARAVRRRRMLAP